MSVNDGILEILLQHSLPAALDFLGALKVYTDRSAWVLYSNDRAGTCELYDE
jgi:predicted amidohydrolase YtcJ